MSMSNTEKTVKDIRRNTRRKFSTEEKIRIVLDGLRGESSIAELCRQEGINPNLYYRWSKDFLEAGKKRLSGDTARYANTDEVTGLKRERLTAGVHHRFGERLENSHADVFLLVARFFVRSRLRFTCFGGERLILNRSQRLF